MASELIRSLKWGLFGIALSAAVLAGCGKADTASVGEVTLPSVGPTPTPTPRPIPVEPLMELFADMPSGIQYDLHRSNAGDTNWNLPCQSNLASTVATERDIMCTLEVNELDLLFSEISLSYVIGQERCEWSRFRQPWYYNFQGGYGPTRLTFNVNAGTNDWNGAPVTVFGPGGGSISVAPADRPDIITTPTSGGNPLLRCPYTYFDSSGGERSYCVGQYNVSGGTTSITGFWSPAATQTWIWGPAVIKPLEELPPDLFGFPTALVHYAIGGRTFRHTMQVLARAGGSYQTYSYANYFQDAEWPAAYRNPGHWTPQVPPPMNSPATGETGQLRYPSRYFELECLDQAERVKGRIRMHIREWNEYAQYLQAAGGGAGDPDTFNTPSAGTCAGNPAAEGCLPDDPVNDRLDWGDLFRAPGAGGIGNGQALGAIPCRVYETATYSAGEYRCISF
jgi:hypothetical protein